MDKLIQTDAITVDNTNFPYVITGLMFIAGKYNDDCFDGNNYSKILGVDIHELVQIEFQLINLLNYSLYVDSDLYNLYSSNLSKLYSQQ